MYERWYSTWWILDPKPDLTEYRPIAKLNTHSLHVLMAVTGWAITLNGCQSILLLHFQFVCRHLIPDQTTWLLLKVWGLKTVYKFTITTISYEQRFTELNLNPFIVRDQVSELKFIASTEPILCGVFCYVTGHAPHLTHPHWLQVETLCKRLVHYFSIFLWLS